MNLRQRPQRLGRSSVAVALVALCAGAGGSAVAAKLITGKDVRNSSLTGADIRNRSTAPESPARPSAAAPAKEEVPV